MCVQSQSPDVLALHDLMANLYQKEKGLFVCIPSCDYEELKSGLQIKPSYKAVDDKESSCSNQALVPV